MTSVGTFPDVAGQDFEVVADTRLKPDPTSQSTEVEDPSINIFGENCELVWRQSYPSLGEVGFKTFRLPGRLTLHVSAISIFDPVDQVISDEELLVSTGETIHVAVSFGGDRYDRSYVGQLGSNDDFGVVMVHNAAPLKVGMGAISPAITALIYRWQAFADPDQRNGPPLHQIVGPLQLDAKGLVSLRLHWDASRHPPFPLFKFMFGMAYPE